jgi:hypothetical protein
VDDGARGSRERRRDGARRTADVDGKVGAEVRRRLVEGEQLRLAVRGQAKDAGVPLQRRRDRRELSRSALEDASNPSAAAGGGR